MSYTPQDARLIAHTEALWNAINTFFARFTTADWMRPHGKDWTFGDVPYHLMYFQTLAAEAIKKGHTDEPHDEIRTLRELNAFNNSRFAARPANQTGVQSFSLFRRSEDVLRQAIRGLGGDQPDLDHEVWYGVLRARGWHTTRFMLDYNLWHNWLHFTESYLRYHDDLPPLDAELMHRTLDLHMELTAGALNHAAAKERFTWELALSGNGGGIWTFVVENGDGHVQAGKLEGETPDVRMERSIEVHLKSTGFRMLHPLRALALSKIKTNGGINKITMLGKLFAPKDDEEWTPISEAEIAAVRP